MAKRNAIRLRFPQGFEYQREAFVDRHRFKVLCWGAQAGKTRFSLYTQAAFNLEVGGNQNCWITRDGKFARDEFRLASALIPKELLAEKPNKSDLFYRLKNGSTWWFYSGLEPDAFRGKSWASAVFNEASYCKPEGWKEVVAPRLRGWAIFNFTPKGQRNWTYSDLWRAATASPDLWYKSRIPTLENPTLTEEQRAYVESLRNVIPDASYRQEILAEFVSDFGRYFNPKAICWTGRFEPWQKGKRYAAGLDWAKTRDFSALAIRRVDVFPHRLVYFERIPHMDYTAQVPLLAAKLREYGNPECFADASEAAANELMRAAKCRVEDFFYTGPSKQHLCDQQRVEFEQGGILMPATAPRIRDLVGRKELPLGTPVVKYSEKEARQVGWLEDEIEFFEPYLRGGRLQLGARGEHNDDILNAIMLSGEKARAARAGGGGFLVVS